MRGHVLLVLLVLIVPLAGCVAPARAEVDGRVTVYLDAIRFPRLVVELDFVESRPPATAAIEHLVASLKTATARSNVEVVVGAYPDDTPPLAAGGREWTTEELDALAIEHQDLAAKGAFAKGEVAVIHVLYVRGSWSEGNANGLATSRAAFIFGEPDRLPQLQPSPAYGERAVLLHEVGHLLGLVNDEVPMVRPHEDPESRHHSANPESVMYRAVDAFDILVANANPSRAPPAAFDSDDLADLRVFRDALNATR